MGRARLGWLIALYLLSACERGQAPALVEPDDPNAGADLAGEDQGPELPIIVVPQRAVPVDFWAWSFDPSGRLVAAEFDDDGASGCGVWDIESGLLVRAHDDPLNNPCIEWGRAHELAWEPSPTSVDGRLRAEVRPRTLEIAAVDAAAGSVRDCPSCAELLAWSPVDHRLATTDGQRLELWDGDTGERLSSETLDLNGELVKLTMRWAAEGLVVAALQRAAQADDAKAYALSSFWWPINGDPLRAQREVYRSPTAFEFVDDPSGRWLIFMDPEHGEVHVIGAMAGSSRLARTDARAQADSGPRYAGGRWRVDAATQWLESYTDESRNEYLVVDLELGWRATVTEPNPGVYQGAVFHGRGFTVAGELELLAAASGEAVARWEGCADYEGGDRCEAGVLGWTPGDGDALLDVSPQLSLALVERDAGLHLVEARGAGASLRALGFGVDASLRWGRGQWLAVHERGGRLAVVDLGSGQLAYARDQVIGLPDVPLAAQHDLLVIEYADRLELVNGASGELRIELAGPGKRVALSPAGERLAVIGAGRIEVLEVDGGATITSFEVGDASGVAWRQDGAVLFYGDEWPTHAVDPETGEPLDQPALDLLSPGELDPSWRWIHHSDGSITRTLDFARIEIGASWARTDSGWFEGELADLPERARAARFRIGDDADAVPVYLVEDLQRWLRRDGLVQGFFLGEDLPVPRIPANAAAKLAAGR